MSEPCHEDVAKAWCGVSVSYDDTHHLPIDSPVDIVVLVDRWGCVVLYLDDSARRCCGGNPVGRVWLVVLGCIRCSSFV